MAGIQFRKPDEKCIAALLEKEGYSSAGLILRLAWLAGLLRGEIAALTWKQISFTQKYAVLPDRTIPLPSDLTVYLRNLYILNRGYSDRVLLSDARKEPMAEQSISRIARNVLNQAGEKDVRLVDLRHDYILRQLAEKSISETARISGMTMAALQQHFTVLMEPQEKQREEKTGFFDAEALKEALQREGLSPAGSILRLAWQGGLSAPEIRTLEWDQLDLFSGGTLMLEKEERKLPRELLEYLRKLREKSPRKESHVVLSARSLKPLRADYVPKLAREALVRAGMDGVTLLDLKKDWIRRTTYETPLLKILATDGHLTSAIVAASLGVPQKQAYPMLRDLVKAKKLVRVGARYYDPEVVPPPEQHEEIILRCLREQGSAVRQDLVRLLNIEPRQAYPILRKLIASGKIRLEGNRYYPVQTGAASGDAGVSQTAETPEGEQGDTQRKEEFSA